MTAVPKFVQTVANVTILKRSFISSFLFVILRVEYILHPENEPFTLDAEIITIAPRGYLFCQGCGSYEHHPLKNCADCGHELIRAKHISIRTFIKLTAHHGAGPINTLFFHLFMDTSPNRKHLTSYDLYDSLKGSNDWRVKLYDEATELSDSYESKEQGRKALTLYKQGKLL